MSKLKTIKKYFDIKHENLILIHYFTDSGFQVVV